jgi:hypothetical protein
LDKLLEYTIRCDKNKNNITNTYDKAKNIITNNSLISCLVIKFINNNYIFEIIEATDKVCIDRSLLIFENIKKIIKNNNIKIDGEKFIFHYKGDACKINNNEIFPLLSHSRYIGCNNIIIWPLTLTSNTYFHYDLNYYLKNPDNILWENKKNIFFFRGMNSGNTFSLIKDSWNLERGSRINLLLECLKLPKKLQEKCDISFDYLYPNIKDIEKNVNNLNGLTEMFKSKIFNSGKTILDLQSEIKLVLQNIKPRQNITYLYNYKYIFCPEGFDVSSGLNWVLSSNSIAIVPPFHYENTIINSSYLQPYVHYLPIKEDYSDLGVVIEWAINNDEKCKEIVKNANKYMELFLNEQNMQEYLKNILINILN